MGHYRPLRILLIQPWIRAGGAELLSLHLAEELQRRGHEALIAALFVDAHGLPDLVARRYALPPRWLSALLRRSRALTYALGPFVLLAVVSRAAAHADLLNPHNVPAPFVAALVGRALGLPVVWQLNEVPEPLPASHAREVGLLERVMWRAAAALGHLVAASPSAIVVLSDKTRLAALAAYGREAVVVWPGVDADAFAPQAPKPATPPLRLLFVGKLHPQKEPLRAVRVAAALASRHDARLVVVGDGPLRGRLLAEAARTSIADHLSLRGIVSRSELRRLYAESHVLLVPAAGHQSWGLVPFEALAAGTPAVVSDELGSAPLLRTREAALVVPPTDEAFVAAAERLAADPALRDRLVENGRQLLRDELRWSRFAERCEEVFLAAARPRESPQRGVLGAVAHGLRWRVAAALRLYREATWRERLELTRYGVRESVALLTRGRIAGELWIQLGDLWFRLAAGRYELAGYLDVWIRRLYEELEDFRPRSGWLVVDVGANVGFYTMRQARRGARLVAIEPHPGAARRLANAARRNGFGDLVRIENCAAGAAEGEALLSVGITTLAATTGGPVAGERERHHVRVRTLDAILDRAGRVDLMKIDAEGAEVDILRGATRTLARTGRVVLEHHGEALLRSASAALAEQGFECALVRGPIAYFRRAPHAPAAS